MDLTPTQRRAIRAVQAGAALASFVVVACSSFGSSSESPPLDEAGIDGALTEADLPSVDAASCAAADLTKDPLNCGKCGHNCEGGACMASVCQPVQLAQFTDEPVANVVLTGTHVFWNTMQGISGGSGNVYACLKGTCGGVTKLPQVGQTIVGLASDGDQRAYGGALYAGGGIFELGPASLSNKLSTPTAGNPVQMSLRKNEMFYLSFYDPANASFGRTVRRWDYAEPVTTTCTFVNANSSGGAFTDGRFYLYANATSNLHSCALVGGNGQFVEYRTNVTVASLTASSDRVFWTDSTGIVTSSPDGEQSATVQTEIDPAKVGNAKVTSVTVSRGELFATTGGGELWSCAPSSCASTLHKVAEDDMLETFHTILSHTVAADANAVYYIAVDGTPSTSLRTSRLMKVAR